MMRMTTILDRDVKGAILRIAECEMRDPRHQAGLLLRQAFEERGLDPLSSTGKLVEGQ
jgi:hypothetical protein